MRAFIIISFVFTGVVGLWLAFGSPVNAPAKAADTSAGQDLFVQFCSACHGQNLEPIPGVADLRAYEGDLGAFTGIVKNGQGMMPPVFLDDSDIAEIYAFVSQYED